MKASWNRVRLMAAAVVLSGAGLAGAATTNYVALSGNGSDGSSWANAWTNIQAAINDSVDGDVILIKTGAYPIASQLLIGPGTNLTLRGGYEGAGEPGSYTNSPALTLVQRALSATNRILSISHAGGTIEGVTLAGGIASTGTYAYGGGVYMTNATTLFTNCVIRNNQATPLSYGYGGGVYAVQGSPVFVACEIRDNSPAPSWSFGAGLYLDNTAAILRNCLILRNTVPGWGFGAGVYIGKGTALLDSCVIRDSSGGTTCEGAGIYATGASVTALHCRVEGNAAGYPGGGFQFAGAATAAATSRVFNCLIRDNYSGSAAAGDGIYVYGAGQTVRIENCTVVNNFGIGIQRFAGTAIVTNCIVWGNGNDLDGTIALSYSCVENADTGTNVIHGDPRFEYGYYLGEGSACTNAGGGPAGVFGLDARYAGRGSPDSGTLDLGYHAPAGYALDVPDLYVATNGADGNAGTTEDAPLRTIGRALARAQLGSTVHVAAGLYTTNTESFPLLFTNEAVKLVGTNAALTVIDAVDVAGSETRVMEVTEVGAEGLISNLTFRGGYTPVATQLVHGAGLWIDRSRLRMADCVIRDNRYGNAYQNGGGVYVTYGGPSFSGCVFTNNRAGLRGFGGGLYVVRATVRVESCVFVDNRAGSESTYNGGGAYLDTGDRPVSFANCLIVSNRAMLGAGIGVLGGGIVMIASCTIADNMTNAPTGINQGLLAADTTVNLTLTNSILWGNGDDVVNVTNPNRVAFSCIEDGDFNTTNGCVKADPRFVDRVFYHLKSTGGDYRGGYFKGGAWGKSGVLSPLLDAGNPASDWSKEPDYPKGRIEMGAYGNTATASRGPLASGAFLMVR